MIKQLSSVERIAAVVLTAVGISALWGADTFAVSGREPANNHPAITITNAPTLPPGDGPLEAISGTVSGQLPSDCSVVLFAYGDQWYVQPWVARPYTRIAKNGTWATFAHGGHEYAALLVKPEFKPPATMTSLPEVGGDVLATTRMNPRKK